MLSKCITYSQCTFQHANREVRNWYTPICDKMSRCYFLYQRNEWYMSIGNAVSQVANLIGTFWDFPQWYLLIHFINDQACVKISQSWRLKPYISYKFVDCYKTIRNILWSWGCGIWNFELKLYERNSPGMKRNWRTICPSFTLRADIKLQLSYKCNNLTASFQKTMNHW